MIALELKDVKKSFDGIRAVDGLSAQFEEGRVTALVGPNGAGKTTAFNLICGYASVDEGTVKYREQDITGFAPWQIAQRGIGRLFQDVRIFDRMTAKDNILAAFNHQRESLILAVVARWKMMQRERALTERTMEFLDFVGLTHKANELAEDLSYGQQKLLAIARLLAADADVLLLDEPVAGVSPRMVDTLLRVIRQLAKKGKTIVVIEHNMDIVAKVADWVYFMDEGRVVSFGSPSEVLSNPQVRDSYVGL